MLRFAMRDTPRSFCSPRDGSSHIIPIRLPSVTLLYICLTHLYHASVEFDKRLRHLYNNLVEVTYILGKRLDEPSSLHKAIEMGNREALLVGAKRCLYEKGYARTTARDIAAASGVSLAAIGYHYGSVEALLNAAMIEAIDEWGQEIGRALAADVHAAPDAPPLERFAAIWTRVITSLEAERPLWIATFEALAQIERSPEVRAFLADALQQGREGLAMLFQGIDPATDPHKAQIVGSFYQALMSGVGVQCATDAGRAPSGRDLAEALRIVTGIGEEG